MTTTAAARCPSPAAAPAAGPRPVVRLFAGPVQLDRSGGLGAQFEEVRAPLLTLEFDYGDARVRASDPADRFFCAEGGRLAARERDRAEEARAQRVLESFGAVDLTCLETAALPPGVEADYAVGLEADTHSRCWFTQHALPQLRTAGWEVHVDETYPYQVLEGDPQWYARVVEVEDKPDWFNLELGVEVDGQRVNLLQALLDLLEGAAAKESLETVALSSARFYAVRVNDTHCLPVAPDRMRHLMRVTVELYRGESGPDLALCFDRQRLDVLERIERALGSDGESVRWEDDGDVRERARRLVRARSAPAPDAQPEGLRATLRDYQREGVAWMQRLRASALGGVLADDMGLGKTLQTIAHLAIEKAEGRLDVPALVVAPTSLVGNWEREIRKFAPGLRTVLMHGNGRHSRWRHLPEADVVITSYPLLVRDEDRFAEHRFHVLILDEAQTIKNPQSQAHRAVRGVDATHRLCLSGTPLENHLGELWSLMDFLNPGLLGGDRWFRGWYQQPIERQGDEDRLQALRAQIAPYVLRRLKSEVARELPPKTELYRPVELAGKQRELYESIRVSAHAQVRQVIQRKGLSAATVSILDALMKLRQVCCDPRLVRMEAARFVQQSSKYQMLMELLEQQLAGGHRVLVFSQFARMLGLISQGLGERGVGHLTLTGATQHRQRVVEAFEQGDADVFLISLKAGGTGLTLTGADTVVHYDPWWNPAVQDQATDRAYRIGQTRPVIVHNLFAAGSVEERMLHLQRRKRELNQAVLATGGTAGSLTEHDLDVLFAPLDD
ncbi:MAG: DEAD/DEAH box helicase [Myxococcota bacterium]